MPFLKRRQRGIGQTEAVVTDLDPEFVVLLPRADVDVAGTGLLRDAVLDRVLDQRLQEQRGQQRVERLRLDVETDDEPIGESRLLDFQVLRQELELGLQA